MSPCTSRVWYQRGACSASEPDGSKATCRPGADSGHHPARPLADRAAPAAHPDGAGSAARQRSAARRAGDDAHRGGCLARPQVQPRRPEVFLGWYWLTFALAVFLTVSVYARRELGLRPRKVVLLGHAFAIYSLLWIAARLLGIGPDIARQAELAQNRAADREAHQDGREAHQDGSCGVRCAAVSAWPWWRCS